METSIGKLLKQKTKSKKLTNKQIGDFINLSPDTVKKLFNNDHIETDRLIQFCELVDEDLIYEFYYTKEPMKRFKEKEIKPFKDKIAELEKQIAKYKKEVQQLEDHIKTQKQLIKQQEEHIRLLPKPKQSNK